jgi:hypothetical protein
MWQEIVSLAIWGGILGAGTAFLTASYQVVDYCRENAKSRTARRGSGPFDRM